ncbi:hypothetical protein GF360_03855 [candidate division WWE3 bacterium]|nr:hypothetical protein [candidate division WWE3 bacterium]
MEIYFYYFFVFVMGLFVGSFLNLVADRLVSGESILFGRSHCDFCDNVLKVADLIPVFSFVFNKGKCRYCSERLSVAYPLSEVLTGVIFLLAAVSSGVFGGAPLHSGLNAGLVRSLGSAFGLGFNIYPVLLFAYFLLIFSVYIVIFLADTKYQIIPNEAIFTGLAVVGVFYVVFGFKSSDVVSAVSLGLFFWFLHAITKGKGMGFGDVRLAFLIGLFNRFPYNIIAIFSSFVLGSVVSLGLMALGKKGMKDKIAFGPFMILGSLLVFVAGDLFLNWYL